MSDGEEKTLLTIINDLWCNNLGNLSPDYKAWFRNRIVSNINTYSGEAIEEHVIKQICFDTESMRMINILINLTVKYVDSLDDITEECESLHKVKLCNKDDSMSLLARLVLLTARDCDRVDLDGDYISILADCCIEKAEPYSHYPYIADDNSPIELSATECVLFLKRLCDILAKVLFTAKVKKITKPILVSTLITLVECNKKMIPLMSKYINAFVELGDASDYVKNSKKVKKSR